MFSPLNDARTTGVTGGNRTFVDRSTVCRLSHSATVTLGARSTSRTCLSGFSDRRLDRNGLPGDTLVEEEALLRPDKGRTSLYPNMAASQVPTRLGTPAGLAATSGHATMHGQSGKSIRASNRDSSDIHKG